MSKAQPVITAVVVEGRSKSEVARDYDVSRPWVHTPVTRYEAEGAAAFDARSRPALPPADLRKGLNASIKPKRSGSPPIPLPHWPNCRPCSRSSPPTTTPCAHAEPSAEKHRSKPSGRDPKPPPSATSSPLTAGCAPTPPSWRHHPALKQPPPPHRPT